MLKLTHIFLATKASLLAAAVFIIAAPPVLPETINSIPSSLNLPSTDLSSENKNIFKEAYACQAPLDKAREFPSEFNSAPALELQGDIDYWCDNEFELAITHYQNAIAAFGNGVYHPPTHLYMKLARAQTSANQVHDALSTYNFIIAHDSLYGYTTDDRAYSPLGEPVTDYGVRGNAYAAPTVAEESVEASAYFELGRVLEQQGRLTEAISAYQQAIDLSPTFAHAYSALSYAYFQLQAPGYIEEALATVEAALNLEPDLVWARYYQGYFLIWSGNRVDGLAAFRQVIDAHTGLDFLGEEIKLSMALDMAGEVYLDQKNLDLAISTYEQVISLNPSNISAYLALGNARLQRGDGIEVVDVFEAGLRHTSENNVSDRARLHYEIAKVFIYDQQWTEAKLQLETALTLGICRLIVYSNQVCFSHRNPFASQMTDVQVLLDYVIQQI